MGLYLKKLFSLIERFHGKYVFDRRGEVLFKTLSDLIPNGSLVLDIGCGNGVIDHKIMQNNPGISIKGIDVLKRQDCLIDCKVFDGIQIPMEDSSVDLCMFVDVLHHTHNIKEQLKEACRVTRKYILIKDHICEGFTDYITLKFMDWIGNRPHGVNLIYNYINREQWNGHFLNIGLEKICWNENINLYSYPAKLLFDRRLHFIALLEKN